MAVPDSVVTAIPVVVIPIPAIPVVAIPPISPTVPNIGAPPAIVGTGIPARTTPGPAECPIEETAAEVHIDIFPGGAAIAITAASVSSIGAGLLVLPIFDLGDLLIEGGQGRTKDYDENNQNKCYSTNGF